jgi:hypothetical protein
MKVENYTIGLGLAKSPALKWRFFSVLFWDLHLHLHWDLDGVIFGLGAFSLRY